VKQGIAVAEAKALVAAALPAPRVQRLALGRARGRVLAADLRAPEDLPAFASSAMDGYAVRAAEVDGACAAAPRLLPIAGEIAAGAGGDIPWPPASVLRIMTGAPVPPGCDGVVPVELAEEGPAGVHLRADLAATGSNLRPAGEDLRAGAPLLAAGTVLGPAALALLAAQGVDRLPVWRLPRVSFLATGDELVPAGRRPGPGQLRNSNGPAVLALLAESGFPARDLGIAPDAPGPLRTLLAEALAAGDVLVTSGGVSMGRHDLVATLLVELGAEWRFHGVRQQPGKPLAFLSWRGRPVFGLPGNPVSTFMTLWYYVLPALRRIAGHRRPEPAAVTATLAAPLRGRPDRQVFARARLEWTDTGWLATPRPPHGSHVLSSLAAADAFVVLAPGAGEQSAGAQVRALLLAPPPAWAADSS
jgi:molybdopterin molybdotransferase